MNIDTILGFVILGAIVYAALPHSVRHRRYRSRCQKCVWREWGLRR